MEIGRKIQYVKRGQSQERKYNERRKIWNKYDKLVSNFKKKSIPIDAVLAGKEEAAFIRAKRGGTYDDDQKKKQIK